MKVAEALKAITSQLEPLSESARLDAQVLLAHIMQKSRAWILAHPDQVFGDERRLALEGSLERLSSGEPLPYVIGHWEFFGLDFDLNRETLIPRPETELLVEQALEWLRQHPGRRLAADVGTGSGCIAIALAAHIPDLTLHASDISVNALEIARRNARKHKVAERIQFLCADLLDFRRRIASDNAAQNQLPTNIPPIDLIAANLPYIPSKRLASLAVARNEPRVALDGGEDGLEVIRRLLDQAPEALAPGGMMLVEIDASHGDLARSLAQAAFPEAEVAIFRDVPGLERLVGIQLPEAKPPRLH
jgi:release factor glutamine methyltransferase